MRLNWLLCIFLCTGCVYRSTITTFKAKNGSQITRMQDSTKVEQRENTIFDNSIDLQQLFSSVQGSENTNSVSGILINKANGNYIEWERDSSRLEVRIKKNGKTQISDFYLNYNRSDFSNHQLEKIDEKTYRLSFQTDSIGSGSPRRTNFTITKSANYLISDGSLQIWSGEIYNHSGTRFTFLILNDPDHPIRVATDMCFLTVCDLDEYDRRCEQKCKPPRKGNVYAKQKWKWWGLFYDIICEGCE